MKIQKRRLTGTYRIDLTEEELTQLSEALTDHPSADPRVRLLAGIMGLAVEFPGAHTVKEEDS